jgi:hypothetical protein
MDQELRHKSIKFNESVIRYLFYGNISGGNQPLHANYENFNLSHTMLIQQRSHGRWKGWFAKSPLQITPPTSHEFCKSPLPPPMRSPLDQNRVTQIEVFIVCMKRSVSTGYAPLFYCWHSKSLISRLLTHGKFGSKLHSTTTTPIHNGFFWIPAHPAIVIHSG